MTRIVSHIMVLGLVAYLVSLVAHLEYAARAAARVTREAELQSAFDRGARHGAPAMEVAIPMGHVVVSAHEMDELVAMGMARPVPPAPPLADLARQSTSDSGMHIVDIASASASPELIARALHLGDREQIMGVNDVRLPDPMPTEAAAALMTVTPGHFYDLALRDANTSDERRLLVLFH